MLHQTCRRAKQHTIILVSRCSGPVLSMLSARTYFCSSCKGRILLRGRGQRVLGSFCSAFGKTSRCLEFMLLAKMAGFSRMDIFDKFGRPGSVDVSRQCRTLYNVARGRLRTFFRRPAVRLTTGCRCAIGRVGRLLEQRCSKCRFKREVASVCGPFDVLGTFSDVTVHSC